MAYTGINMENVKSKNLASILKLLNTSGPMSRKDIALQLGLTPATMTMLCAELLNEGILGKSPRATAPDGAKSCWISITSTAMC